MEFNRHLLIPDAEVLRLKRIIAFLRIKIPLNMAPPALF